MYTLFIILCIIPRFPSVDANINPLHPVIRNWLVSRVSMNFAKINEKYVCDRHYMNEPSVDLWAGTAQKESAPPPKLATDI